MHDDDAQEENQELDPMKAVSCIWRLDFSCFWLYFFFFFVELKRENSKCSIINYNVISQMNKKCFY